MVSRPRWSSAESDTLVDIGTSTTIRVKVASEPWEFDQIHRLNYRTFVEEIRQHAANASGVLIDKFDRENTYIIAVDGHRVLGMIAVRGRRPFSLDAKLADLDAYLPPARRICEFRLLAIDKPHRAGRLLQQLIAGVWSHCRRRGYDLAVMSGTTRQLRLYRHLGFVPFGPLVGGPSAQFQPMLLTRPAAQPVVRKLVPTAARNGRRLVNLLPGPVPVRREVQRALSDPAASHRSETFASRFAATQSLLRRLASAAHVQLLLGSGTLANDAIAAQLSLDSKPGVVLSNGEFGERLIDHAARFGLAYEAMQWPWGCPFDLAAIEHRLAGPCRPAWLWFVQLETSTGVLNDLDAIKALGVRCGVELCVDAISSLGAAQVDLNQVRFAASVSGKGLGAFPGVAIVFHDRPLEPSRGRLPRYLDLELYAREDGVPFTHSSNLVGALHAALQRSDWDERFRLVAARSRWLRACLRRRGFDVVGPDAHMAPGVVTIALPPAVNACGIAAALHRDGFEIAANSAYLQRRNWIQIAVIAEPPVRELTRAVDALCRIVF